MQIEKHDELRLKIQRKEEFVVKIENDIDFDEPPSWNYIVKNQLTDELYVMDQASIKGCKCQNCTNDSDCCPKLIKRPFSYKTTNKDLVVLRSATSAEVVIECGDLCECGPSCINRLSQKPKTAPICLFKTKNRGWGIKTMSSIAKGTLIIEYVGELIGQSEANSRSETAFLFDLKSDLSSDNRYYTIDAFKYGNLSRFINHSCEPNMSTRFINNCDQRPDHAKLW